MADALCISAVPFSVVSAVKHCGHHHELVHHAVTSALPPRQLPLRDLAFQPMRGHTRPILHVSTHQTQPLAITVDSAGSAMLWDLTTLNALGLVSDLLQGSGEDPVQVAVPELAEQCSRLAPLLCTTVHTRPCSNGQQLTSWQSGKLPNVCSEAQCLMPDKGVILCRTNVYLFTTKDEVRRLCLRRCTTHGQAMHFVAHDMDLAGAVWEHTGNFVRFAELAGATRL